MSRILLTKINNSWFMQDGTHCTEVDPYHLCPDGSKIWVNSVTKRVDTHPNGRGPSCVTPGGSKEWRMDGKLHRIDGPAIEFRNGHKYWFINGIKYTEEEYESEAVLDIRSKYASVLIKSAIEK